MYRSLHAYDKSHIDEVDEPLFHFGVGQHHILYRTLPGNRGREHTYIGDGWGGWRSGVVVVVVGGGGGVCVFVD